MKRDRNNLEVGTEVRWLNNGWVLGVIREKVIGAQKIMYLCDPPFGNKEFGGASHTTGWPNSLIGADCLVDLGPDSKDTLTPPNLEFAYGDSLKHHKGELPVLPKYYPQDRNMYKVWREQKDAASKPAAVAPTVTTARVRERPKPAPVVVPVETMPTTRVRTRVRTP